MDKEIGNRVKEALERGWAVGLSTIYEVQERSFNGEIWYSLGSFHTLDDAVDCKMRHFDKWYSRSFDSVDDVDCLRIVMRHIVEVVL